MKLIKDMDHYELRILEEAIELRRKELRKERIESMFTVWTAKKPIFYRTEVNDDYSYSYIRTYKNESAVSIDSCSVFVVFKSGAINGFMEYQRMNFS